MRYAGFVMDRPQQHLAYLETLTAKQKQVLALVAEGLTSKEIGRKLGVSESAVNQRIETIRQRMDGMSRANIGRLYRQISTLSLTIPTSNSLTGNPIQLQASAPVGQQPQSEGVEAFLATASEVDDELQPSTLPSWFDRPPVAIRRTAAILALALAFLSIAILVLVVGQVLASTFKS